MLLATLGGYLLSGRALKPVDRMTRAAIGIGITNLSRRIRVEQTGDELQRLGEAWNDLFARLEDSVARQQQFTSDASHDLRTSIAVILATGQLTLRHQRTEEEYREAIAVLFTSPPAFAIGICASSVLEASSTAIATFFLIPKYPFPSLSLERCTNAIRKSEALPRRLLILRVCATKQRFRHGT